jgi:secreted trypsin-like serine protease
MYVTNIIVPIGTQLLKMNLDPNVPSATGEALTIMGFGSSTDGLSADHNSEQQLREAPTEYLAFEDCAVSSNPETGRAFFITGATGNIITGVTGDWFCTFKAETSTCVGDSGGPVILEGANADEDLLVASVSG